jgi:enoyl-CoA hydratase/carnithine racemase
MDAVASSFDTGTDRMIARIDGPVGWMIFNNPARRNAVSADMWAAIPAIIHRFETDPEIRVIALAGSGDANGQVRAFVSGADISQFEKQRSTPDTIAAYDAVSHQASQAIKYASKPTVAVIRGWCIGGGLGIAVGCDLRFATDTSKFGVPAGRLGLGYAFPGVKTLHDLVGPAYTKEIFYTARHFSAAEALAMGLINRALPEAEFDAFIQAQFETIAANAPLTLHTLKRSVEELARGNEADQEAIAVLVKSCFDSEDYKEGRRAFMEKRKPVFHGH